MDPELAALFAARVRELRMAAGLTQEALAVRAGLHRTHVSLIERGERSVRLETVQQLATALGVAPADLFVVTAPDDRGELERLFPYLREFQRLAARHGIDDVFQDNGGKLLQTLILLNLRNLPGREGNDATDADGHEYELKTVNRKLTRSFSTHHHLNPTILAKYRAVHAWYFSVYEHIELVRIYRMTPGRLEIYFGEWERRWNQNRRDLNNPKIPLTFVEQNGELVYQRDAGTGAV
ncbi:MAG: helix-turn-helix domain-containing protein [Gemmataceae bacterium]